MNVLILGILCLVLVCLLPNDTNTKKGKNKKKKHKNTYEKLENGTQFISSTPVKRTLQIFDIIKRKIEELIGG